MMSQAAIDDQRSRGRLGTRRVLVWGGLGLIGSHAVQAFLDAGWSVSVLCRGRGASAEPVWSKRVDWFELDGREQADVFAEAIASASAIINLAGSSGAVSSNSNPLESLESNCRTQLLLLEACRRAGHNPHIVFASSRLVYGFTGNAAVCESHPVAPQSIYGAHKLCIENYLRIYAGMGAITYTVCRISNVYGPDSTKAGCGYKILNSFIVRSLAGDRITLFGTGEQIRDFIYVDDLCQLLILCSSVSTARNETFNIGSGLACRLIDAANIVRRLTNGQNLNFQPWPEAYLKVESGDYISDIGKAVKLLGFAPRFSLEQGIAATVEYHQRESMPVASTSRIVAPELISAIGT